MHTRIRYLKQENWLVSKENYLGKEHVIKVVVDLTTMNYKVLAVGEGPDKTDKVLEQGAAKTLASVKKHVKAVLKALGVQFMDEVRNKKDEEEHEET